MAPAAHREFKNRLYGQFARIGKALSSPLRLELLELLAQAERTVESLASEIGLSLANTSQHLKTLRQASLVESRKQGLYVYYRLADPAVCDVSKAIRTVAEERLAELDSLVRHHFGDRSSAEPVQMEELLKRLRAQAVVILDTRPANEYVAGHIAGAISVPVDELQRRLRQLPRDKEYVAYCRGPYTHVHADHPSGGADLARRVGAQYCLHESADIRVPFMPLRDGEEIDLGNTRLKILHTPGHSAESKCLVVTDLKRGVDPWNPMLALGRDAFIEALADVPPKPADMERILATNRGPRAN